MRHRFRSAPRRPACDKPAPAPPTCPAPPAHEAQPSGPDRLLAGALRGIVWAFAQNGGRQLIAFVAFVGLARLLEPQDFGLVALASVFVLLTNLLLEQGLGEALVQAQRIEPADLDTAFWATLAAGLLLALAWQALAAPVAALLGSSALEPLLRVLALQYPLTALCCVPQALLQRQLDFRALAIRSLAALGFGCTLALALAAAGLGAWSLVAQQLGAAALGAALLWRQVRWRPGRSWSLAQLRPLHRFGRNIVGVGLLDLVNRKFNDLVIGAALGPVALGLYGVAYQATAIVEQLLSKGFDALALSALSRLQSDRPRVTRALCTAVRSASMVALPLFALGAVHAQTLIVTAFGARWADAAELFRILAFAGAIHAVFHYNHAAFKALGRPGISVRLGLIGGVVNVIAVLCAVRWGVEAVAWAGVLKSYAVAPLSLRELYRLAGIAPVAYLRLLLPSVAATAVMVGAAVAFKTSWQPELGPFAVLVASTALGMLVYLLVLMLLARDARTAIARAGRLWAAARATAAAPAALKR